MIAKPFVRWALILVICSTIKYPSAADDAVPPTEFHSVQLKSSNRRRLQASAASRVRHLDSTATARVQRDSLPDPTQVPYPELYYYDHEYGTRLLIWPPDETLPRDVLARRPEVWLHVTVAVDLNATAILPHFLEHYSRLGM